MYRTYSPNNCGIEPFAYQPPTRPEQIPQPEPTPAIPSTPSPAPEPTPAQPTSVPPTPAMPEEPVTPLSPEPNPGPHIEQSPSA